MSLLERFQAGSEFETLGEFTLDESKAREKMARFQLVSNEEFLMLLVQACVAASAQSLEIDIEVQPPANLKESPVREGTNLTLWARGVLLHPESLLTLVEFLFDSSSDNVAYHLLAVAANSIEPLCYQPPLLSMVGEDLHFQAQLKVQLPGLLALIDARLPHLPCPLMVNGGPWVTDPLDGEPRVQFLSKGASSITLIRHGVVVARQQKTFPIEFRAIAEAPSLRLDASYSQVVEDDRFQAVIRELSSIANQKLAQAAQAYQPDLDAVSLAETRRLLDHLQAKHPGEAGQALRRCRLFPLADRGGSLSLLEIEAQISELGRLLTSGRRYNLQLQVPVLLTSDRAVEAALKKLLPPKILQDAEGEFRERVLAEKARLSWEDSPRPTELPPGDYLCQAMVSGPTWKAAIGYLARGSNAPSRVDVLYQGKLLGNEPIQDLPPGAVAVLDVAEGQVHQSWTRLDGREYRAIQQELRDKLKALFAKQRLQPEHLHRELQDYLLEELTRKNPSPAALTAPLFPTLDGEVARSINELAGSSKVLLGDEVTFGPAIPETLMPRNLVLFTTARLKALNARLGTDRVQDVRTLQKRLQRVEAQMSHPLRAVLPEGGSFLVKQAFRHPSGQGEIALLPSRGKKLQLSLLQRGVVFETTSVAGGKVLEARAVVEAAGLQLDPGWTRFVSDRDYKSLTAALQAAVIAAEQDLIKQASLPAELRLELLLVYPQPDELYWNLPLLSGTEPPATYSLAALKDELALHGHLLRGSQGVAVPGRAVLLSPSTEAELFLQAKLGPFEWKSAQDALQLHQRIEEFQNRPIVNKIAVPGRHPIRRPLAEGRGEVVLPTDSGKGGGELFCYLQGRFLAKKYGFLMPPLVGAIEHHSVAPSSDFNDVVMGDGLFQVICAASDECMLAAAQHKQEPLRLAAWKYFATSYPADASKQKFKDQLMLELLDGSEAALSRLAGEKIMGYVRPDFSRKVKARATVLRLTANEAELMAGLLGRKLSLVEKALLDDHSRQQALSDLPTELPKGLFSRTYGDGALKAVMGVSPDNETLGYDSEGYPVGYLRDLYLPVRALVYGAEPSKRVDESGRPIANLPGKGYQSLTAWAEELCLLWVETVAAAGLSQASDRKLAFTMLLSSSREIGSSSNRASSRMASLLWDMPLFGRVDGTRVSGTALAAGLGDTAQPLLLAESRLRAPASAVLLDDGSDEHLILGAVLGKNSLQWYEAPLLFDSAQLGESVKRLVSWGFSPVLAAQRKVADALRSLAPAPDVEAKPARRKARQGFDKEIKERDPRESLLVQLREDIRNLLGDIHWRESDLLFQGIVFSPWPLGPPIWRPRDGGSYRFNSLHPAMRWLASKGGDERSKRAARMLLLIHWVGLVNVASERLTDKHEDEFLSRLVARMTQTFA